MVNYTSRIHHKTNIDTLFNVPQMITMYYQEFHQNYFSPTHTFDYWQINLVTKGSRDMRVNGEMYHLEEGQMIFVAPKSSRQILDSYGFNDVVVCGFVCHSPAMNFFNNKIINLTNDELELFLKFIHFGVALFERVDNEEHYGLFPRPDTPPGLLQPLKIYLELFLVLVYNRLTGVHTSANLLNVNLETINSRLVSGIKDYFAEHINENLTIEQLAANFSVSASTIKKSFKQVTTQSVMNYFLKMKIEKAKSMIAGSTMTISEIGESLGFNSATYFSTAFKKVTGEAPGSYAKRHKQVHLHANHKFVIT